MIHVASRPTRLLIRPKHVQNESLRGYVSRVSSCNGSSPLLKPMLVSLQATTNAIQEIATLTGCNDTLLRLHGSHTQIHNDGHSGVLFGSCVLPTNRVRMLRRRICPMCLAKNGVSICCWELRDYDVCHDHGCYLVGICSGCDRLLSWTSTSSETCSCGVRLADIKTQMASMNRALICKLLADEMSASITRADQEIVSRSLTPLHLFFMVSNFVRSVLIPSFAQAHLGARRFISEQAGDELLLVMFSDREYYLHLYQVIFHHAVKNPMMQTLWTGITVREMNELHLPCLEKVTLHAHLFKIKADVIKKRNLDFQRAPGFVGSAQRAAAGIS